jgi:hypothetical protein
LWACAAGLAALSLAALGPATCMRYFTDILPAHERSELSRYAIQYSLSAALYAAGVAANVAVRLGDLSYLVALAFGAYAGGLVAKRLDERAFLAYVPAACAVVGGPFLHRHDLAVALPLALLALTRMPQYGALLIACVAALSISPEILDNSGLHMLVGRMFGWVDAGAIFRQYTDPAQSAEVPWEAFVRAIAATEAPYAWKVTLFRLPVWGALAALVYVTARAAFQASPAAASRRRLEARA